MLPTATDNGARLAAILPSGIAALGNTLGIDEEDTLSRIFERTVREASLDDPQPRSTNRISDLVPRMQSLVVVVVDGLGQSNLKARAGHARTLASLPQRRIETVIPSTTAAALTTLVTGQLPGEHGLIGYRIRHPQLGVISPLRDWEGIAAPEEWQRSTPLFETAAELGLRPVAIGRPAHAGGGLTAAILSGAEYLGGQRIEDRFAEASRVVREADPALVYLYVDELDKAGHELGWESEQWLRRLEQLDAALDGFLRGLPGNVGVVVTADHGMVDVPSTGQVLLDVIAPEAMSQVDEIGGDPRMRSLYLRNGADPGAVVAQLREVEQGRAWISTREEATAAGWYGRMAPGVADRLGDIIIAARKQVAYYLSSDDQRALDMVGQHGSLSAEERGIPLILGGCLEGSGFASAVTQVAQRWIPLSASA